MKGMKFSEKVLLFIVAWVVIMAAEMSLAFLGGDPLIPIMNVIAAYLIVEVTDLRKKTAKRRLFGR